MSLFCVKIKFFYIQGRQIKDITPPFFFIAFELVAMFVCPTKFFCLCLISNQKQSSGKSLIELKANKEMQTTSKRPLNISKKAKINAVKGNKKGTEGK